LLILFKYH